MDKVDQSRFDNQPSPYLTGPEAAELLGVKRETLYAYVSRGLLRAVPGPRGRARLYARADVERLKARSDARAGHGPVAAGALRWGEPVLESAISGIGPRGPVYRGRDAAALARADVRFEAVAELLWTGSLPAEPTPWERPPPTPTKRLAALLPPETPPLPALTLAVAALGPRDATRHAGVPVDGPADTTDAERSRARGLVGAIAALIGLGHDAAWSRAALATEGVARRVLIGLGERPTRAAERAVDRALVVSADHELNASTFAVRVAASAGADLYACLGAGLAALSGPRHGASCDRVEALIAEADRPARAAQVVRERMRRGEAIPGFGHTLYPNGDARADVLLDTARSLGPRPPRLEILLAICEEMRDAGREPPTLDIGLAAIAAVLDLPLGAAAALFAVGRSAGWIAHAFEQREAGFMLRPRARYTGPPAGPGL